MLPMLLMGAEGASGASSMLPMLAQAGMGALGGAGGGGGGGMSAGPMSHLMNSAFGLAVHGITSAISQTAGKQAA